MSDRSSSGCGSLLSSKSLCALLLIGSIGCGGAGSSFGSGGTTATSTGGSTVPASGTGGFGPSASGGNTVTGPAGTGGDTGEGTGFGGSSGTGGGPGSGGRTGSGGTAVAASGGRAAGGAPATGTGGTAVTGTGGAAGPVCPKPAGQICHELYVNDNSANHRINYVNEFTSTKPGGIVWTAQVPAGTKGENSPRTLEIVNNALAKTGKALLVSIDQGYVELDVVDGTRLVSVTSFSGITGACRIPDGTTALADVSRIIIASPTGVMQRTFNLPAPSDVNLRAINRHPVTGNYWLTKTEVIYEVTPQGTINWQANMPTGSKGYSVWWRETNGLPDGAYATTGDPGTVVEIDGKKNIVRTVGGDTIFSYLDFFSGFVRLPNGNFVVANWLGHHGNASGLGGEFATHQVVEFTPDNKVVWSWGSVSLADLITNVMVVR
jgi:hypothetical protein